MAQASTQENWGVNDMLSLSSQQGVVHPSVPAAMFDHYMRQSSDSIAVGALMGVIEGSQMHIMTAFGFPLEIETDTDDNKHIVIDEDHIQKMVGYYKKVSKVEKVLGFFTTQKKIDDFFGGLMSGSAVREIVDIKKPILLTMEMKLYQSINESAQGVTILSELKVTFKANNAQQLGLDVLCYGQEDKDTLGLLLNEDQSKQEDKQAYSNNVVKALQTCEAYVQKVLKGEVKKNSEIGRMLNNCLQAFSTADIAQLQDHSKSK